MEKLRLSLIQYSPEARDMCNVLESLYSQHSENAQQAWLQTNVYFNGSELVYCAHLKVGAHCLKKKAKRSVQTSNWTTIHLASNTRPDISSAVDILGWQVANLRPIHWTATERNFRYLKGPVDYALILNLKNGELTVFASADWARSVGRVSIAGDLVQLGRATVYWKNINQKCITLSSTESKYGRLSSLPWEATGMRGVLCEMNAEQSEHKKITRIALGQPTGPLTLGKVPNRTN